MKVKINTGLLAGEMGLPNGTICEYIGLDPEYKEYHMVKPDNGRVYYVREENFEIIK